LRGPLRSRPRRWLFLQFSGAALIIGGSSYLHPRTDARDPRAGTFLVRLLLLIVTAAVVHDIATRGGSVYGEVPTNFTMLAALAVLGLIVILAIPPADDAITRLATVAAMLLPALAIIRALNGLPLDSSPETGFVKAELSRKIADYWMPFAMLFPAARLVALGFEWLPQGAVAGALLALLILPFHRGGGIDFYTHEHSISENWKIDFSIASNGYWISTGDSRWTFDPAEAGSIETLHREVLAERITTRTHVLHLVHDVTPFTRWVRFSVFTGINDDPVVIEPKKQDWPMFMLGSRVRPFTDLELKLAAQPKYILSEIPASESGEIPSDRYRLIYNSGGIRLYRRLGDR
jgi:hypothetical protein